MYIIVLYIWSAVLKPCAVLIEDSPGENLVGGSSWLDHMYVNINMKQPFT